MLINYCDKTPNLPTTCYIAPTATVIGDVHCGEHVNVWFGAVIRGDVNRIEIGANTNVQDNAVVHVADGFSCIIGTGVTIGHSAIVHACEIGNNTLIGMGAIVLDGAVVEDNVIIGAGSLVPPGKRIPAGHMAVGSPAKVVRALTDQEKDSLMTSAEKYVALSKKYFDQE